MRTDSLRPPSAAPPSRRFPLPNIKNRAGQASLSAALGLVVATTVGVAVFDRLGTAEVSLITGTTESISSNELLVGSKSQAGLAAATRGIAQVSADFAEAGRKINGSFDEFRQLVRERPYRSALDGFTRPALTQAENTQVRRAVLAYAKAIVDQSTELEQRISAHQEYWNLIDEFAAAGDARIDYLHAELARKLQEVSSRLEFAHAFRKDGRFRQSFVSLGLTKEFKDTPDFELIEKVGKQLVPRSPTEAWKHPTLRGYFDRYRHALDSDHVDPEVMTDGELARLRQIEVDLSEQVVQYRRLQERLEPHRLTHRFARIAKAYDEATQEKLWQQIIVPRESTSFAKQLDVAPGQAFVFHGPPGTGKTYLARRIAELLTVEDNIRFVEGAELNGGLVGEAEKAMRELFHKAVNQGTAENPYVIIFDELDGVIPNDPRSAGSQARRSAFLSGMDRALKENPHILIFGATNAVGSLDIALRRPGRFGQEIFIGAPSREGRLNVLRDIFSTVRHELDFDSLADFLEGLTFADLVEVVKNAKQAVLIASREAGELKPVRLRDIQSARKNYVPTMLRENDFQVRPVAWEQIAGLDEVIEALRDDIVLPLTQAERFARLGADARPKSALFHGPPGTGKTLLAAALATDADINIITALASNLRTPQDVARLFERARNARPSLIFIDEIEAIAKRRAGYPDPVVNQLLTEMDGLAEGSDNIIVVGTTNFVGSIDEAVLRPGRLESHYYVGLPDEPGRRAVFDVHSRGLALADGNNAPNLDDLARRSEGYTPADIKALVERAVLEAAKRDSTTIGQEDFDRALQRVKPSLSRDQLRQYQPMRERPDVGFRAPSGD